MDFLPPQYDDLIARYFEVCNAALQRNKNCFPFKQVLGAVERASLAKIINIEVTDHCVHACYLMIFQEGGLTARPRPSCLHHCGQRWAVSFGYLEDVVKRPEGYIENPAKINWEWAHGYSDYGLV